MHPQTQKYARILGIAPSTRGFGFAVLDGQETLVDWGGRSVEGDKNASSLLKIEKLVTHYQPDLVVMEDSAAADSRRAPRIQELGKQIVDFASNRGLKLKLLSRTEVRSCFFEKGNGTKQMMAQIIADRFPAELGSRLPPKRKLWMSEDYRMDIFDAAAIALAFRLRAAKGPRERTGKPLAHAMRTKFLPPEPISSGGQNP